MTTVAAPSAAHASELVVAIDGEMTIYRAVELKLLLIGALAHAGPIRVDLSKVTELDSAGVQLVMLARQLAECRHTELAFVAPSDTVREVFRLLGLEHLVAPSPVAAAQETA